MPIRLFEVLCLLTVALTLGLMARSRPLRALAREYVALAIAGAAGEESMIFLYRFYSYAPSWDAKLVDVPLVVVLIWPLVILSARDVVIALTRSAPHLRSRFVRALLIGVFVTFDASLVEVVAVRAGLWTWAEPGHLGVPIIGVLGWGFFAFGASLPLVGSDARMQSRPASLGALVSCVLGAPLIAHVMIQASWWSLFRWRLRGDLGSTPRSILAVGAVPLALALLARFSGAGIPIRVALPRIVAALLFAALLWVSAGPDPALLASVVVVAVPYSCLTVFSGTLAPQHPDREVC